MSTTAEFFTRYNVWAEERADIQQRDGDGTGIVSSSEWQGSDDESFELLESAVSILRTPITLWSVAVKTPDSPGLVTFICNTEAECFETLRDQYDPEGNADDEPPVAIVEHLQDDGYLVEVNCTDVTL